MCVCVCVCIYILLKYYQYIKFRQCIVCAKGIYFNGWTELTQMWISRDKGIQLLRLAFTVKKI